MAKSNGELVQKAARLVHDLGRDVATVDEARKILSLSLSGARVRVRARKND